MRTQDGMLVGARGNVDADLRIGSGEAGEKGGGEKGIHAPRAAGPVAVMEVEAFALEDECANAVSAACHCLDALNGHRHFDRSQMYVESLEPMVVY